MTETMWVDLAFGLMAKTGSASHTGYYRKNNEDFVHVDAAYPFALVLDGLGGHAGGEVASRRGAEAVADVLRRGLDAGAEPRPLIERAIRTGHKAVLELSRESREFRGCGTTLVLALIHNGVAHVSWLGDSPAYRISRGRIEKLTWEHDLRNALVRHGAISEAEARTQHINSILWRFLGSEESNQPLEIPSFTPRHGDRLLLATDGITGALSHDEMLAVCESHPDPSTCAEELVNRALESGSRDNCTCAVIAFERDGDEPHAAAPKRKWWQFWQ